MEQMLSILRFSGERIINPVIALSSELNERHPPLFLKIFFKSKEGHGCESNASLFESVCKTPFGKI
jgi:hypothetical protein